MQYSMSIEYAIHGLVYLARAPEDKTVLLGEIASSIKVPKEYTRKIFQLLTRKKLITARRGAGGGYRLSRPAAEISLLNIVEAIEGSLPAYSCLRLHRHCEISPNCPVKRTFDEAREKMGEVLQATSILSLSKEIAENRQAHSWLKVTA